MVQSSSAFIGVLPTSYATSPPMQRARPVSSSCLKMGGGGSASRVDFLRNGMFTAGVNVGGNARLLLMYGRMYVWYPTMAELLKATLVF